MSLLRCLGNVDTFPDEDERASALKDARLSFPSGHASFSFQTSVFIVLYLQASGPGSRPPQTVKDCG